MGIRQSQLTAQFLAELKTKADVPRQRIGVLLRAVGSKVGEALVVGNEYGPGTPVDTGNARGHWYVAMGAEPPAAPDTVARDASGKPLESAGALTAAAMHAMQLQVAQAEAGDIINFVNDVPYIEALNNGHSQQAPNGMTDMVAASFDVIVATEAARLGIT